MQKLLFSLFLSVMLTGCFSSTPGVQNQGDGTFKVECSPFEEKACQKKAEKKCAPNPIKVLNTQIIKKYSSSTVVSDNAIGLNDNALQEMQAPKYKTEVLVATFTCNTVSSSN